MRCPFNVMMPIISPSKRLSTYHPFLLKPRCSGVGGSPQVLPSKPPPEKFDARLGALLRLNLSAARPFPPEATRKRRRPRCTIPVEKRKKVPRWNGETTVQANENRELFLLLGAGPDQHRAIRPEGHPRLPPLSGPGTAAKHAEDALPSIPKKSTSASLKRWTPSASSRTSPHSHTPTKPVLLCWEKPPLTASNWCHRRG